MEECNRLDQNHPYATNNLAYLFILLRMYKQASDVCKKASSNNQIANNYFRNWAIALLNLNQYSDAVEVIRRAIEIDDACSSKHI